MAVPTLPVIPISVVFQLYKPGCSMGKFIGIGAGAVVGKDGQVEGLGGLVQVEEKRRRATPV